MLPRKQGDYRDDRSYPSAVYRRSSPVGAYPGRVSVRAASPKGPSNIPRAPAAKQRARQPSVNARCEQSEVTRFLRQIGLPQYAKALFDSGFEDMETLLEIEEDHMRDLGILPGHQVKLRKRLDEYDADIPVVQINPNQRCIGDWEDEDDAPPARAPASLQYGRGSALNDRTATSVQMSWAHLKEIGTDVVGAYFLRKIFELKPETKELFPLAVRSRYRDWATDEEEDERNLAASPALRRLFGRVVDAVGSAVAGLQDMNKMVPALTQLGMRHVGYNLKEEYFEISEKALVLTLREGLGDLFTKEVEFAWSMVYNFIIATMLAGFRKARADVQAKQAEIAAREPREPVMSTTATPSETPSSASGSARREGGPAAQPSSFGVGTELDGGKEPYRLEKHLQKAIFGDVYEATAVSTGRRLAVKVTELEKMRLQAKHQTLCESPLCEIRFSEMMKGLDNVVQLEDTFGDDDRHYVVMDLASGGDLMEALQPHREGFQEEQAKLLVLDVARGLASLHMRGLAMQDVTLENMLLFVDDEGQWQVRVGDPGQAVAFVMDPATGQEKPVPYNGLVADDFRPPELYDEQEYLASRVDSWCLGWNTFYLLTAVPLFKSSDPSLQDPDFMMLQQGRISQLFESKGVNIRLSYDAKDFVTQLMHKDPVKRMPIKDALWHPWLKETLAQQMRGELTPQRAPLVPQQEQEVAEQEKKAEKGPPSTLMSHAMAHGAYLSPVPEQVPKFPTLGLGPEEVMYSSLAEDPREDPSRSSRTGGPCSGRIGDLRAETQAQAPAAQALAESSSDSAGRSLLQAAANWSLEHLPTLLSRIQSPDEKNSKA